MRGPGEPVVLVLGRPHYYPRFGFVPAATKGLPCEYPVSDDVFLVTELIPGALRGRTGLVNTTGSSDGRLRVAAAGS